MCRWIDKIFYTRFYLCAINVISYKQQLSKINFGGCFIIITVLKTIFTLNLFLIISKELKMIEEYLNTLFFN